jgi:hypothetical protein
MRKNLISIAELITTDSIESRLQGKCYQNILCASWQGGKEGAKGPIYPGSLNKDKVKYE